MCVEVPARRPSQATQGHLSRHRSSHTPDSQETHQKLRDGSVSGFIQNHKNPGAWLPQVRPLHGLLPASHHVNVRITGQIPAKPQSAWHWQRLLKSWKPYYVCICGRTPLQRNVAAHYRAHRQGKPFRAPGGSGHLCWSCRDLPAHIY